MTDPVAEAASNLAKQHAEPTLIEEIKEGMHDLAEKVEHLIHPETVPNVTPGSPAIEGSTTLLDVSGQPIMSLDSVKPSDSSSTETLVPASPSASIEPLPIIQTSSVGSEAPNVLPASTSGTEHVSEPSAITGSIASSESGEVPNGAGAAIASSLPQSSTQSAPLLPETSTPSSVADLPNGVTGAAALPAATVSALGASIPAGIQGVATVAVAEPAKLASEATSAIKASVANIKHHLNIRGFEQSAVADIHAELADIEKWL